MNSVLIVVPTSRKGCSPGLAMPVQRRTPGEVGIGAQDTPGGAVVSLQDCEGP